MKKILALIVALSFVLFTTPLALAGYGDKSEQELYGSKVPIAKYWIGQCLESDNETVQQLSDGTFAMPGDSLYTCNKHGLASNWTDDPSLNPWGANSGTGIGFPYLPASSRNYPWGTSYPGGYANYSDWFRNCVLFGTLILSDECMSYPRTYGNGVPVYDSPMSPYGTGGYSGYGYGGYGGYSGYGGSGYSISIENSGGDSNVTYSRWGDSNRNKDLLATLLIGAGTSWLINKLL